MSKQPNRPRLGRGLSALLSMDHSPDPTSADPTSPPDNVSNADTSSTPPPVNTPWRMVRVDTISPNPHQPRRTMNESSLADLAASLRTNGLLQPIVVRELDGSYQLIAGERRFRAAKLAGLDAIPAIVRQVDPYDQAQLALVENIHREDLNPMERALAYDALMSQLGLTQAELAVRLGEQRSSVANFLRLLELAEPVRALVRDGKLSLGHAKVLAGVTDAVEQGRLADLVVGQDLSVRNLERLVTTPAQEIPKKVVVVSAHLKELESSISRQIGLRVQVRGAAKKGRLVIHYTNLDQFDELVKRLGVALDGE